MGGLLVRDDRIAAIVSDEPGESAWYGARLVLIDVADRRRTHARDQ